ncbi:MAG: response regulator [Nitrospirae bacterium]|nr:response regulator [Nitrospirota bacterium]
MSKHILIVDDEPAFRFSAGIALRQAGYITSEAQNGREALSMICIKESCVAPFDAVLLDIQMPKMTGLELIDEVKAHGIDMPPVIVISGYADEPIVSDLEKKGYSALLHKPFEPTEMVKMIHKVLHD